MEGSEASEHLLASPGYNGPSYGAALPNFPGYPLGRPGQFRPPSQPLLTRSKSSSAVVSQKQFAKSASSFSHPPKHHHPPSKRRPSTASSTSSTASYRMTLRRSQSASFSSTSSRRGSSAGGVRGAGQSFEIEETTETTQLLLGRPASTTSNGYYHNAYGHGGPSPSTTAAAWGHSSDWVLPAAAGVHGYEDQTPLARPKTAPAHVLSNGWARSRGRCSPPPPDVVHLFRHRAANFNIEATPEILRAGSSSPPTSTTPLDWAHLHAGDGAHAAVEPPSTTTSSPSAPAPAPSSSTQLPFSSASIKTPEKGVGGTGGAVMMLSPDFSSDDRAGAPLELLELPHAHSANPRGQLPRPATDNNPFTSASSSAAAAAAAKVDAVFAKLERASSSGGDGSDYEYDSASQPTSPTSQYGRGSPPPMTSEWIQSATGGGNTFAGKLTTATQSPSKYLFEGMAAPGLGGVSATSAYLDLIEGVRDALPLARRARRATMLADEAAAAEAAAEVAARRVAIAEAVQQAKAERRARQRARAKIASEAQRKRDAEARAKAAREAAAAAEKQRQKEHEEHLYTWGPFSSTRFGFTVIAVRHHAGSNGGARVVSVESGGPADTCKLREGDVLVDVAFRRIMNQAPGKIIGKVDDPKRENVNIKVATHDQVQALPSLLRKKLLTDKDLRRITLRLPAPQTVFYDLPGPDVAAEGVFDLRLKSQGLSHLPERVIEFTQLTKLNVAGNNLEYLPPNFVNLINLQRLDLSSNHIKRLPEDFGKMKELTALYLFEEKELEKLPKSIGGLQKLEILNAPHNALTSLPESVGNLQSLRRLWLADNDLRAHGIPDLGRLTLLTNVNLDGNPFVRFPKGLKNIPTLRSLSLNRCELVEVPAWVSNIDTLVNLSLAANELKTMPPMTLPNLSTLDLSFNLMVEFPASVATLTTLAAIFLQGNGIMSLPIEFLQLLNLAELNLGLFTGKLSHVCHDLECCAAALTTRDVAIYIPPDDNDYSSDENGDDKVEADGGEAEVKETPTNVSYMADFFELDFEDGDASDDGGGGGVDGGGSGGGGSSRTATEIPLPKAPRASVATLVLDLPSVPAHVSRNLLSRSGGVPSLPPPDDNEPPAGTSSPEG